ncbi:tyrosine-protein phosphatase [Pseudoalteromonas shioyasakiensis]|uniref:tyrosine-protein phosphatase n=1 Tax=Pseudoalteromonas shioyasakiensis TaxID=1190813 RepID=UPI00211851F6|nr:tyrosine-protein phosphatase [Pseudoalteromonas shioyasakiensis]MCQ8878002.1 tyrosine-protein phosphatase [Pseudoalteromonas shioyasakiensis]
MKTTLKYLALCGLLSTSVAAQSGESITQAQAQYEKQAYQLTWSQSVTSPVDILVSGSSSVMDAKVIAEDVSASNFQWQPDNSEQRYYFFIKPENGQPVMTTTRLVPLEGGRNFRDIGGYQTTTGKTVKWGKIYRSGALSNLTADDYTIINELDIGTVVDFRTTTERSSEVTKWAAKQPEMISQDYEMDFDMAELGKVLKDPNLSREMLESMMTKMYPSILDDQTENYTAMFDSLVEKDSSLLFHCTAGKDRTGISAALVLAALGVDKQTIIDDYMATNQYLDPRSLLPKEDEHMDPKYAAMMKFFASLPEDIAQPLLGVTEPLIKSAISAMEAKHGSMLEYVKQEFDVSDKDILTLRSKYLQ